VLLEVGGDRTALPAPGSLDGQKDAEVRQEGPLRVLPDQRMADDTARGEGAEPLGGDQLEPRDVGRRRPPVRAPRPKELVEDVVGQEAAVARRDLPGLLRAVRRLDA